jgi:predicted deacylase
MQPFDTAALLQGDQCVKQFGHVPVMDDAAATVTMPVGVICSGIPGPTLCVTAGLFPTEFCGIEAASRLYHQLQPCALSRGKLVVLPCVNHHGLQWRSPWMGLKHTAAAPFDGRNLNASFPGSTGPQASLTERQAACCFGFVRRADYHIDFRGGDLSESHLVHTIFPQIGSGDGGGGSGGGRDEEYRNFALALGLQYNLPATPADEHSQGGSGRGALMGEAIRVGVCSVITECGLGFRQQPQEKFVRNHLRAAHNALRHCGMLGGAADDDHRGGSHRRGRTAGPAAGRRQPLQPMYQPGQRGPQRMLLNPFVQVPAPVSGLFTALADQGDQCGAGDLLGRICGLDGSTLAEVRVPPHSPGTAAAEQPVTMVVHEMYPARMVAAGASVFNLVALGPETGYFSCDGHHQAAL